MPDRPANAGWFSDAVAQLTGGRRFLMIKDSPPHLRMLSLEGGGRSRVPPLLVSAARVRRWIFRWRSVGASELTSPAWSDDAPGRSGGVARGGVTRWTSCGGVVSRRRHPSTPPTPSRRPSCGGVSLARGDSLATRSVIGRQGGCAL